MNTKKTKNILDRIVHWFKKLDWRNPRIILTSILFLIIPMVAKYYVASGMILGLTLAVAVLWLLDKSPKFVRKFCLKFPLLSDILLSTISVLSIGAYFGEGLVLGLGALFSALILSWAIPNIRAEKVATQTI
jgi:hypothetical protein